MKLYAHYFTGKLIITASMQPINPVYTAVCNGKRQARIIAQELGATPWNF